MSCHLPERRIVSNAYAATVLAVVWTIEEIVSVPENGCPGSGSSRLVLGTLVKFSGGPIHGFAICFNAGDYSVAQEAGVEIRGEIELIGEVSLCAVGGELIAINNHCAERRSDRIRHQGGPGRRRCPQLRFGNLHVADVVRVTHLIAKCQMAVEVVLGFDGPDVVIGAQEVAPGEAVVVIAIHRRGAVVKPRNAIVRNVVRVLMEIAEGCRVGVPDAESECGRNPEPAVFRDIPPGYIAFIAHHVQPERVRVVPTGHGVLTFAMRRVDLSASSREESLASSSPD